MSTSSPEGSFEPSPSSPQGPEQRTMDLLDKTQEVMRALENNTEPDHERAIMKFGFDIFGQETLKTILPARLSNHLTDARGQIIVRGIDVAFDSTAGPVQRSDLSVTFNLEDLESGSAKQIIASKPAQYTASDTYDIVHVSDKGDITELPHDWYDTNEISRLVTYLALRNRDWDTVRYTKNVLDPQDKQTMLLLKDQLTMHASHYKLDTKYEHLLDKGEILLRVNRVKSEHNATLFEIEILKTYIIDHVVYGPNTSDIETTAMLLDEVPLAQAATPLFSVSHQLMKPTGETLLKDGPNLKPGTNELETFFNDYLQKALVNLAKTRPSDISYETFLEELGEDE